MGNNCAMGKNRIWILVLILAVLYFCGGNSLFGTGDCDGQCCCNC